MKSQAHQVSTHRPALQLAHIARALVVIGAIVFVVGWLVSPTRTMANLLSVSMYWIGIALGAGFLLAGLKLCGAKWARGILDLPARFAPLLAIGGAAVLVILLLNPSLYPWYDPDPALEQHLHGFKGVWLTRWFMIARTIVFLAVYLVLLNGLVRAVRTGSPTTGRWAAGFVVAIMLTIWLAVSDWVMSLEPIWYSTMFGFYCFSGFFISAIAAITLVGLSLKTGDSRRHVFTDHQLHDLGKLQFAFSTFWMYIWFSQYMLIWYTNNPEETSYFIHRLEGAWAPLFTLNLFLNWIVPFFGLMSARSKRSPKVMAWVAVIVLIGHWLDLYLMILPTIHADSFPFGLWEIGLALGGLGAALLVAFRVPLLAHGART